jgi:CRISPR-associated protein Csd1
MTMLLQALHKYATDPSRNLLANLPFQRRTVHLLISVNDDGSLRGSGFHLLTTQVVKKHKTREEPGREFLLPRFPGEKNNTRAQYLADPAHVVLGVNKETLEPLSPDAKKDRDVLQQHRMFWRWADEAAARLSDDPRLQSLRAFRDHYLATARVWLVHWTNPKAREPEPEPAATLASGGEPFLLVKGNTVGFEIEGQVLAVGDREDPLWADWSAEFMRAFREEVGDPHLGVDKPSVCLLTGEVGGRVAVMHKPEVKIRGTPPKGAAFFSCGSPAFTSYGFADGENAATSVDAAAAYSLALEDLLRDERRSSFEVGGVTFCFWAEGLPEAADEMGALIDEATPSSVLKFLKAPFGGTSRTLNDADQFLSTALSANGGRIMVREWLKMPLAKAVENLQAWFHDLEIARLGNSEEGDGAGPYALKYLATAAVREGSELERVSEVIAGLYRSALENLHVPVRLLGPVLAEFRSALVTDSKKKPKYPFSQSRFALIKLILTRTPNGGFRPMPHLSDTDDAAYNLGRLLCVLSKLQDAAHEYELEGPGIVERYYGTASSAPASVFAVLWKLHNHHLRKLEQQGDKGKAASSAIRNRVAEIVAKFPAIGPSKPPQFPRQLSLEEQGRFALGFYQQLAADQQARRDAAAKKAVTE